MPKGTHLEQCAAPALAYKYCTKEETRVADPETHGVPPAQRNVAGDVAARNKLLLEEGAEKAVEKGYIPLKEYVKIRGAIKLYNAVVNKPEPIDKLNNIWIYGPPGTGKSRWVTHNHPGLYDKPLNKWWDAYEGEDVVALDDFGKEHACLGGHIKRWADHYPFTAEIKGSATTIRPKQIIVTSNYTPEAIWPEDEMMSTAVRRRF